MANELATVFDDIVARIRNTGMFDYVEWGHITMPNPGANARSYALVSRTEYDIPERNKTPDVEDIEVLFRVRVRYQNPNAAQLRTRYMNMESAVYNALHRQPLGGSGMTIPQRNQVQRAVDYSMVGANEYIAELRCRFVLAVPITSQPMIQAGFSESDFDSTPFAIEPDTEGLTVDQS
jgi:hypothetical protein